MCVCVFSPFSGCSLMSDSLAWFGLSDWLDSGREERPARMRMSSRSGRRWFLSTCDSRRIRDLLQPAACVTASAHDLPSGATALQIKQRWKKYGRHAAAGQVLLEHPVQHSIYNGDKNQSTLQFPWLRLIFHQTYSLYLDSENPPNFL